MFQLFPGSGGSEHGELVGSNGVGISFGANKVEDI